MNNSLVEEIFEKERLQNIVKRGRITLSEIESGLKENVKEALSKIEEAFENLEHKNRSGLKR